MLAGCTCQKLNSSYCEVRCWAYRLYHANRQISFLMFFHSGSNRVTRGQGRVPRVCTKEQIKGSALWYSTLPVMRKEKKKKKDNAYMALPLWQQQHILLRPIFLYYFQTLTNSEHTHKPLGAKKRCNKSVKTAADFCWTKKKKKKIQNADGSNQIRFVMWKKTNCIFPLVLNAPC